MVRAAFLQVSGEFNLIHVCLYGGGGCMCLWVQVPAEDRTVGSPRAGAIDSCEPPEDVSAGNGTQIPWMDSKGFSQ